ncbi:MAG: sigma-70 family RNA polymerase sigma factor [Kiritimatiellae bacterium]|nr:sigma-70 family RNA polymerase sigma factor [Kiritimatiellia bacterium]
MHYRTYKNEVTRSSVMAGVKEGSDAAWKRFYDLYAGFIYGIARSKGLMEQEADEIVQNVMLDVISHFKGDFVYDRKKGSFRGWLGHLVGWRVNDLIRQRTHISRGEKVTYTPIDEIQISQNPELDSMIEEEWRAVTIGRVLKQLQEETSLEHFQVFYALEIDEWPTEKVCKTFGVTRGNAYQIRKRLRDKFDTILKQELNNDEI